MKLYCDMDGVLVLQTGRTRFDLMGWKPGGRDIWAAIKGLSPSLLSMQPDASLEVGAREKRIWAARELGPNVPVIVVGDSVRKFGYAEPGALLIDDSARNCAEWRKAGGAAIQHINTADTLTKLKLWMEEKCSTANRAG